MDIRQLVIKDWRSWRALRLEALLSAPEAFVDVYEEVCTWEDEKFIAIMNSNTIYGAFDGDKLIGIMSMGIHHHAKSKHQGVVWGVYIKPEYRGQHIADKLLQAIIQNAKSKVEQLQLSAHTENHGALRLYQRHGFEVYGTEPRAFKYKNRYYDECYLMLLL